MNNLKNCKKINVVNFYITIMFRYKKIKKKGISFANQWTQIKSFKLIFLKNLNSIFGSILVYIYKPILEVLRAYNPMSGNILS